MKLQEFVRVTTPWDEYGNRPQIVCKDGFKLSVQGSAGHYCDPRGKSTLYNEMEIGFPSLPEDLILEYAEEPDNPTGTVYGYVPVDLIQKVITKHGGIDLKQTKV